MHKLDCSATQTNMNLKQLTINLFHLMLTSKCNVADQTARMRRLICVFVICAWQTVFFSRRDLK